ncbi:MAG TPA: type I-F CRISPR-associated protein Csy2, partial [Agitococcus sp.]|nr:type I-F CRISPR-associated protein Csy2 [Agitococcus sp.]
DSTTPHRFAESVITLGEFVMPYRISDIDQMLWQYHVDQSQNLYLCQTNTQTA